MSAKRKIYDRFNELLRESGVVKTFKLFNNQYNNEATEKIFLYPSAFLEFASVPYITRTDGVQVAEGSILRLHIGFESLEDNDLDVLETLDAVFLALQGQEHSEGAFGALKRVNEAQDVDHDRVQVWQMDFETTICDDGAARVSKLVKVDAPHTVEILVDADAPYLRQSE